MKLMGDLELSQAKEYLNSGQQNLDSGNYLIALFCFEQAIALNPDLAEAWEGKAATLRKLGRHEEAIAASEEAIALRMCVVGNNARFWFDQGIFQFESGNFEGAIASFEKTTRIQPDFHDAWHNHGLALAILENYEEAISSFDTAVKIRPDFCQAWNSRGTALTDLERYEDAINSFDKAVEVQSNFYQAWNHRGVVLSYLKRYEDAVISFGKAIKIKSDFHEAWNNRGASLAKLEHYEDAIASFDNAIKLKPDFHEALNNHGSALTNLKRYEDAVDSFNKVIECNSDDNEAWFNRGAVLANLKRYEDAIASFDKAVEIQPDYYAAWGHRGAALSYLGRYEESITSFDNAIKFKPDDEVNWGDRGLALEYLGRYEEAIISFDKAINLKFDYKEAWNNRGNALNYLGCYEDAIDSYDKAIEIQPDDYEVWGNRGSAVFNLGRYEEAIASFDNAIKFKPDDEVSWNGRGMALFNVGRIEEAITNYDQGLIHVLKDAQPEGWGELHRGQGNICLYQAQRTQNIQAAKLQYYPQALKYYQTALQTLEVFPSAYLELIQSLIKTHLGLANPKAANQWRIEGLEIFRKLVNSQPTPQQKHRIEAQFSSFSRVAVDALVGAGNFTVALEAAERYKNRCLTWILDEWKEQVTSPSYAEIRELLKSNHEIIYWHFSEETLTTFILTPTQEIPIILIQKSTHFETWQKDWDKRYGDYRSKGKDQAHHLDSHPWRDTLEKELDRLKDILEIDKIESFLSPSTQLILIPHRDLHRFPIHALFGDDRITTYLPSIKVGLAQKPPSTPPTSFLLNVEDPNRSDQPPLQFARLESAIIQAMFAPNVKAIGSDNGDRATVETALQEHHGIFHFTGHGDYDGRQPEHSAIGLTGTDRLTAKEINALNLQQYELVCLSACETALTGRQTIKTEYVGLTSAFLQAGVSNIISTLWTVQEVSNAYLMIRFYQFLLQNEMNPAEALKRSQSWLSTVTSFELADWLIETSSLKSLDPLIKQELEQQAFNLREEANASTIDSHHPPYADPYHWAAFTLTGRGFL
jgi:tetratricopeptide (TPR) repeat protein